MIWSWRTVCTCVGTTIKQFSVLLTIHKQQHNDLEPLCSAGREVDQHVANEEKPRRWCVRLLLHLLLKLIMHSTRSHSPPPLTDSSGHPCKKRSIAKMKKTVKFSPNAKVRSAAKYDDLQAHSSWSTADELFFRASLTDSLRKKRYAWRHIVSCGKKWWRSLRKKKKMRKIPYANAPLSVRKL